MPLTRGGLKHHNIGAMNAATRAVAGETHAVGAMVQEKQYLHAPRGTSDSHLKCPIGQTVAKSVQKWTSNLRMYKFTAFVT